MNSTLLRHIAMFVSDFQSISDVFTGLMQAIGASEKVFEYVDRKPEIALDSGTLAPDRLCGRIEFRNVRFSYPARPDTVVLKVFFCFACCLFLFFVIACVMKLKTN